jgi:hypothetical protein
MDADVARLVDAKRAERLTALGNWSLGQALNHLGIATTLGFYEPPVRLPFYWRWILRIRKNTLLNKGLPAGVHMRGVEGGTIAIQQTGLEEGLAHFNAAWRKLKTETPTYPSHVFGPLTHEEWIIFSLRHAELHLSFFKPREQQGINRAAAPAP